MFNLQKLFTQQHNYFYQNTCMALRNIQEIFSTLKNNCEELTSILSFPRCLMAASSDKPTQEYSMGVNTVVGTLK